MKRLTATVVLLLVACGCLPEPFTGSDVILELGTGAFNSGDIISRSSEHYELFAAINGGLVSIGKFTIDERLDAQTVPGGKRIGVANHQGSSLPLGGIEFHTEAHLQDASEVLLSVEDDGDTEPAPSGRIVGRGTLEIGHDGHPRGTLEGEVATLGGTGAALVESRVTIIVSE